MVQTSPLRVDQMFDCFTELWGEYPFETYAMGEAEVYTGFGGMEHQTCSTIGDGLVAALQVLAVVVSDKRPASFSCRPFIPLPQLLRNVRYSEGQPLEDAAVIQSIATGEEKLSGSGRLLIRKSGTEPLIRVMAEGENETLVNEVVGDIVAAVMDMDEVAIRLCARIPGATDHFLNLRNQVAVPHPEMRALRCLRCEFTHITVMPGPVDAVLLGNDLRCRRIDMLADDIDALLDKRLCRRAFLDRIVPRAGIDDMQRHVRIGFTCTDQIAIDRPIDDAKRVGGNKADLVGFGQRTGRHAAEIVRLIGTAVNALQIA